MDGCGAIFAHVLTQGSADDAVTALGLIEEIEDDLASVTADAAYDTIASYRAADARGARVVVPPLESATVPRAADAEAIMAVDMVEQLDRPRLRGKRSHRA